MEWECRCISDGHCEQFRREMNGRLREICNGTSGLPEEKREAYIKHWKSTAQRQCIHLGEKKRELVCLNCQGTVTVPVYACALFMECLVHRVKRDDLPSCAYCHHWESGVDVAVSEDEDPGQRP